MATINRSATDPAISIEAAPALERHLGYWLRLVSNRVSSAFSATLQEDAQLSVAEWVAMNQIEYRAGLSSAELAQAMGMTPGAVSKVLDKLEQREWLARARSPEDSRIQHLSLTRLGRRQLPDLARIADHNDAQYFGALSPSDQLALRRLLRKIAQAHSLVRIPTE